MSEFKKLEAAVLTGLAVGIFVGMIIGGTIFTNTVGGFVKSICPCTHIPVEER